MANYLDLTGLQHFKEKLDLANDAKYLTEEELEETLSDKLLNVYRYKGSKPTYEELPEDGNVAGDVWDVASDGMNYAWNGTEWDALGRSTVDITIDAEMKSDSTNPVQNKVIYSALQGKASVDEAKKVTQTVTTTDEEYPLLAKNTSDADTITDTSRFSSNVTVNPSTGTVTALSFKGALDGKAKEAAKADNATNAETATRAESADKATLADNATRATTADTANDLAGTLDINKGGTGQTTAEAAWTALGGGDIGKMSKGSSTTTFLRNDGEWATPENTTYSSITNSEIDGLFE